MSELSRKQRIALGEWIVRMLQTEWAEEEGAEEALLQYEEQLSRLKKHRTVSVKLATLSGG